MSSLMKCVFNLPPIHSFFSLFKKIFIEIHELFVCFGGSTLVSCNELPPYASQHGHHHKIYEQ